MKTARPSAISFRYRQGPWYLETADGRVDVNSPPPTVSGMIDVQLDTRGQLRYFRAVPPQVDDHAATTPTGIEWSIFFTAAGLNQAEIAMVAMAVYGFYTSLAGQPLFGRKLFEE